MTTGDDESSPTSFSVRGQLYWILPIALATMSLTVWLLINPKWGGDVAAIVVIPVNVAAVLVPLLMSYSARGLDSRRFSRTKARRLKLSVVFTSVTLLIIGGVYWTNREQDPLEYLSGTVRIGVVAEDYPGWDVIKGKERVGFDIALVNFLRDKYKFTVEYVPLASRGDRTTALTDEADAPVDLVVANFSITPSREKSIDFAGPYFLDNQGFFTWQDKQRLEEIDAGEVCVAKGTTADQRLNDLGWHPVPSPSLALCIQNFLTRSDTNAVSTDTSILQAYALSKGMKPPAPIQIGQEKYGIGIPDGRPKLCAELNLAIDDFLRDRWQLEFDRHLKDVGGREAHMPETTAPCK